MARLPFFNLISNNQIIRHLWDRCIEESANNRIYAKSFYLDNTCFGWQALMDKDYQWVLPITARSKFGVKYLYQPAFTQQLGIFSRPSANVPFNAIIDFLKNQYRFWEVNWNSASISSLGQHVNLKVTKGTNYILDISKNYEQVYSGYHNDLIKNLKKSRQFNLKYQVTTDYEKSIRLFRQYYCKRLPHLKDVHYLRFTLMVKQASRLGMLIIRQVTDENGDVMATALLLKDSSRLYNLMNTTTKTGRKRSANHFLIDAIIKEFAEKGLLFDFEGSDLPGVKEFYENFGPVNEPYNIIRYNNLPQIIKTLKGISL